MNSKKKNNRSLSTLALVLLIAVIVSISMVTSTLAKYVTTLNGTGTAVVAKWRVKFKKGESQYYAEDETFDLFDKTKVYDLGAVPAGTALSEVTTPEVDQDVKNGTTNAIIAPGTWGKIGLSIEIGKDTETSVAYSLTFSNVENDNTIPLEFSLTGSNVDADWKSDITELTKSDKVLLETIAASESDLVKDVTLYWRWKFNVDDTQNTSDTVLGSATTSPEYKVNASFSAEQIDHEVRS